MIYEGLLRKTRCPTCNKPMLQNFKLLKNEAGDEPVMDCYECNHKIVLINKKKKKEGI